jgi:tetratricopeptide (TPR) repeat protein
MAKKKKSKSPPALPLPDRRIMEGILRQTISPLSGRDATGPADQAQELIYQAVESPPSKRVKLAQRALKLWPDCADAYVLLAEDAEALTEAIDLYERAVAAGRRGLGTQFDELVGSFWGFLETRPYMRARLGLAQCLSQAGRQAEAAEHYRELLRLNPNDNQGVREILVGCLLELNRNEELAELLERYRDDGSAAWLYSRALLAFRRLGDDEPSRSLLGIAQKQNKHVPAYLLGDKPLPQKLPEYQGFGDKNEAVAYAANFLVGWKNTPGAISWLRACTTAAKPRKKASQPGQVPVAPSITENDLLAVPQQADETWQADVRRMPSWVKERGRLVRPWMILVIDATNQAILAHQLCMEQPTPEMLWGQIAAATVEPMGGAPRRPGIVQVCAAYGLQFVQPRLAAVGIRCEVRDDLEHIDDLLEHLGRHTSQDDTLAALMDTPGVEPSQLLGFYEAAAGFYRTGPWRLVPADLVIELRCPSLSDKPWYAVVMGQSGMQLGLALYDDFKLLRSILKQELSDSENARRTSAISVTFGEDFELPIRDLDAIERFGWPVAGPEAYPCVLRIRPGRQLKPTEPCELELLEVGLRTIPDFLKRRQPGGFDAATTSGSHSVELRHVD